MDAESAGYSIHGDRYRCKIDKEKEEQKSNKRYEWGSGRYGAIDFGRHGNFYQSAQEQESNKRDEYGSGRYCAIHFVRHGNFYQSAQKQEERDCSWNGGSGQPTCGSQRSARNSGIVPK